MSNDCGRSELCFNQDAERTACSSGECDSVSQGLPCNGRRCLNDTSDAGTRLFLQQYVTEEETVSAHFRDEHDSVPQGKSDERRCLNETLEAGTRLFLPQRINKEENVSARPHDDHDFVPQRDSENHEIHPEMVQTYYRSPLVGLLLENTHEIRASGPSRAPRGFSMVEGEIAASEMPRRYICLGSQFQTETKVFNMRRLSGTTLIEPQGHLAFIQDKLKRLMNKTMQRLHVSTEASRLEGKSKHDKYSNVQVKET